MEEHFKNKLKNHKVDWDKEALLENIQYELSQKQSKSRSGLGWRWLMLLPLLLLSTCWGFNHFKSSSDIIEAIENTTNSDFNNSKIIVNDSSAVDFNKANSQQATKKLEKTNSNKDHSVKVYPTRSVADKPKFENLNSSKPNLSFENTKLVNSAIKKNNFPVVGLSESKSLVEKIMLNIKLDSTIQNNLDEIYINPIKQLPLFQIVILSFKKEIPPIPIVPKNEKLNPEGQKDIADIKKYYFSSAIGNIGLINRSVQGLSGVENTSEELKLNEETINARFLLSTDVTVGYQHHSGWTLESGLAYNRIIEFLDFDDTIGFSTVDYEHDKAFYFLDQNLDTLFFSGTNKITNSEIRKVRHNNYHSYFTIPLKVGYHYTFRKANLFSTAGISYAFANSFKGREVHINGEGAKEIVDNPSFNLKNRVGFHLGIGMEHPLSERTHIFAKAAYQRSPKLSRDVIEQVYDSYSLGIGIKIFVD